MKKLIIALLVGLSACGDSHFVIAPKNQSGHSYTASTARLAVNELDGAVISKADHIEGRDASFSECTDQYSVGGELLMFKYNLGATYNYQNYYVVAKDVHSMGRVDVECYINCVVSNWTTVIPNVTLDRSGSAPTTLAYAGGNTTCTSTMLPLLLGGRNSDSEANGKEEHRYGPGLTNTNLISRASTIRMEQYLPNTHVTPPSNWTTGQARMSVLVPQVINDRGWYNQFMHWGYMKEDYPLLYFDYLKQLTDGQDIYHGSWNKILEYYYVRESVDSLDYSGATVTVFYSKKNTVSPYQNITTPLWVNLDLSGTIFAGHGISVGGYKIRSRGGDKYVVAVPLDYSTGSVSFTVTSTDMPVYMNFNPPVISISGQVVTSDQPVKIVLFTKPKTNPYIISVTLKERKLTTATSFTLSTVFSASNDYYIGAINDAGVSTLITR